MGAGTWLGVWLGVTGWEGDGLGAWLTGSSVAGAVSDGCVASVDWLVGLSTARGVANWQPDITRTTTK